ncbi:hypothetical protein CTRI78_v000322 [Colletotrichum trifolii]|uniref:Zn(2)-C6 fungal-type domain-containing protein n=1 Tax=Colletotrichum trifolii TaxID=5466 RepID=A0A4V3HXJ4_COLTR|nr:hypothetical protein CTRI78_v000322 [Colletotrichum trifolii]
MDASSSSSRQRSPTPLLKTCRTCAHAKIKCDRTQDPVKCDRCLRLGKECTYAPSRGRRPPGPRSRHNKYLQVAEQAAHTVSDSPATPSESLPSDGDGGGPTPPATAPAGPSGARQTRASQAGIDDGAAAPYDPFDAGQLSLDQGQELLGRFRTKLTPQFPFVIVSASDHVGTLRQTRPALCLALLAAASYDDVRLQRALGQMFNELVAARLVSGAFASLDVLQGLLVHLAWAHFQPRPKRYSQHLHLATSIVSDLRLDRSKKPRRWNVEGETATHEFVESLDETRTFLGTYYLSSCSSIVLQKLRIVTLTSYVTETAVRLGEIAEAPTDQYLPYIIRLQRLAEDIDDIVKNESTLDAMQIQAAVAEAKERVQVFKNDVSFPLGDCPLLIPQLYTIQLCLNQLSLPDSPFGLHNPSSQRMIQGLSESMVSAKNLVSVLLHTPPGQEVLFPNIIWVMLHCGFTLAARLDLQAADPRVGFMTEHLRQFSDIAHTVRQVVLRLESASSPDRDDRGDRDSFYHFSIRARRVEKWYLEQQQQQQQQQHAINHAAMSPTMNIPTTHPYSTLGTPASDLSQQQQQQQQQQVAGFEYTAAPSVFSQAAVAPVDGGMTYPQFTMAESAAMHSAREFNVEALAFADSFIPFKSWNYALGTEHGGGAQF